MANRSLKVLPTAMSLVVSFQSAIKMLGMTAEMYSYGSQYMIMSMISTVLSTVLIVQVVVPWMYPLKFASINEVSWNALAYCGICVGHDHIYQNGIVIINNTDHTFQYIVIVIVNS